MVSQEGLLRKKIPMDIEGGMQLDNYMFLKLDFKTEFNERYAIIFLENRPTLNGNDSFLFFTRPWFSCGRVETSGWRPCQTALTHIALDSIAQKIDPKIYLLSNNEDKSNKSIK